MTSWRELVQQKRFIEAEPLLLAYCAAHQNTSMTDYEVERAWFYEEWGDAEIKRDAARSQKFYLQALQGYERYTSWATNGTEALLRLEDVKRVQRKLQYLSIS